MGLGRGILGAALSYFTDGILGLGQKDENGNGGGVSVNPGKFMGALKGAGAANTGPMQQALASTAPPDQAIGGLGQPTQKLGGVNSIGGPPPPSREIGTRIAASGRTLGGPTADFNQMMMGFQAPNMQGSPDIGRPLMGPPGPPMAPPALAAGPSPRPMAMGGSIPGSGIASPMGPGALMPTQVGNADPRIRALAASAGASGNYMPSLPGTGWSGM